MALNPAVKALLDSAGLESNLDDVPAKFEDTEQVVGPEDVFSSFDTTALLDAAGEAPSCRTNAERYWHVRQYYLREKRAAERDAIVADRLAKIQATVKEGTKDQIVEMFKQRHQWRQKADEFCTHTDKICKSEGCLRVALRGSEFCVNHIMSDPNQKLFVECPNCHRPHPVMSSCFACRDSE